VTNRLTMSSGLLNAPTLMGVDASEVQVAAAIKSRTLLVKLPPLTEGVELRTEGVAALQERCARFLTNQHLLATLAMDVFSQDLRRASQMTLGGWCGLHTEAEGVVPAAMLSTVRPHRGAWEHGARRESLCPFWKPCHSVRAALLSVSVIGSELHGVLTLAGAHGAAHRRRLRQGCDDARAVGYFRRACGRWRRGVERRCGVPPGAYLWLVSCPSAPPAGGAFCVAVCR